jgi:hypothetical protein
MAHPSEQELMAEVERLEKSMLAKGGDALQNAPHDGGFATEGTNIQSKATVKKALAALIKGGMSKEDAEKTVAALAKGFPPPGDGDDESSPEEGGDDETSSPEEDGDGQSDEPPMGKSLGAAQLANASSKTRKRGEDSIRKALTDEASNAIDAVPVLGQLVDQIDKLAKSIGTKGDAELRKSVSDMKVTQDAFNQKMAKALTIIAKSVLDTNALVKAIESQPVLNNRAPSLRKSDIVEPHMHSNAQQQLVGGGDSSPLMNVEMLRIQEGLVDLVMKGLADPMDVTKFENSKGNFSMLPPNVVKQLEQRLCPAAS